MHEFFKRRGLKKRENGKINCPSYFFDRVLIISNSFSFIPFEFFVNVMEMAFDGKRRSLLVVIKIDDISDLKLPSLLLEVLSCDYTFDSHSLEYTFEQMSTSSTSNHFSVRAILWHISPRAVMELQQPKRKKGIISTRRKLIFFHIF